MITASALSRLMNCPGSAVLPRAENHNEWATLGHDAHAELAEGVGDVEHEYAHLIPVGSRSEVKLAFDVATRIGRIIGEGGGRDYGAPGPFEIVGSTDAVGVEGEAVVVVDFKTGFADVEPAGTNAQLAFYALAATSALGKSRAIVRIIYTKMNRVDAAELDAFDLAAFADRLEALHGRVAALHVARQRGEQINTNEGAWCKHCASKPFCPSKNALLARFAAGGLTVLGDTQMTADKARAAYEQIVHIDQLVKDAKKRLDTYVTESGPIDLGNGRMYGRYHREGNEKLDGDLTVQAIREVVGESAREFEAVAIERSTSKAAIDRAAKAIGAARGTAPAVIRRVRDLGGSKREATYPIGEYAADKHQAALPPDMDADDLNKRLRSA